MIADLCTTGEYAGISNHRKEFRSIKIPRAQITTNFAGYSDKYYYF
jgi:hypothetical protein